MKKRNPEARCGTCPFCAKNAVQPVCGRFPPTVLFVGRVDMVVSEYPQVNLASICGEHPAFWLEEPKAPPVHVEASLPMPQSTDESSEQAFPKLLNMSEVAEILGIAVRTVWRGLDCGTFPPPTKIGRLVRMNAAVLAEWIKDGAPDCRKTGWTSKITPHAKRQRIRR